MALKNKVATVTMTDVGQVRDNNEDAVGEDPDLGLLVLADGMGGYKAGEIASGITIATVLDTVRENWKDLERDQADGESSFSAVGALLQEAVETAHTTIYQVSRSQPQCEGMGTTAVVALLHDNSISIAYVGDSRLYRLRSGQLSQVTTDHSLVEELIAKGYYSREEAKQSINKNIVTRALGIEAEVEVDVIEEPVEVGDLFLLCSDGLTDLVDDDTICLTLSNFADNLDLAAKKLIALANEQGGKDNISVVLARVDQPFAASGGWIQRIKGLF